MHKQVSRFLVLFVFVVFACLSVSFFSSPQVHAKAFTGSCGNSDNTCSGADPQATGCNDNERNAASAGWEYPNDYYENFIYDRWSLDSQCQTNWPTSVIYKDYNDSFHVWVKRDAGNGLQARTVDGGYVSDCADFCWGNMVYAPTQLTQACISGTNPNILNGTKCATQSGF
ncbi:MAG TPA: hypothetical protein VNG51_02565 [Ktedonobacteraceae bacterium]|nr:hypothetical protein [Ktedonobacteraceae bacterium]